MWAMKLLRSRRWRLFGLCVLLVAAGCAGVRPVPLEDGEALSLALVQAGNVMSFVPAQIFVSREWCHNLLPEPRNGPVQGEYTIGLAILIAENRGTTPLEIPWWSCANWDIVLEPENGEARFFPLHGNRRVDSPHPIDRHVVSMTLAPGEKAAFVVGLDDCGPYEARWGKCRYPPCKMRVEYRDRKKIVRSNDLLVRWREKTHPDTLPNAFRPLEPSDGTEGEPEEIEVEIF